MELTRTNKRKCLPNDWQKVELGKIANLERGKFSARPRNDPRFFGGSIPFIQTGDITKSDGRLYYFTQTLNDLGLRVSKLFPQETLFFTIAANIGDVAISSFAAACPDSLIAVLPKECVDKLWIFYYLQSRKREFEGLATLNAQLNINLEKLNPYVLSVPSLPEQKAIAAALSDIDHLLVSLNTLITKKRHIKQSTMRQLLTGKARLPGFQLKSGYKQSDLGFIPEDWVLTTVRGIASHAKNAIVGGPFGSELVSRDYTRRGTPVIRGQNMGGRYIGGDFVYVSDEKADALKSNLARPDDIVFTQRGTLGQISVVPNGKFDKYIVSQSQMKLTLDMGTADSTFFYYLFSGEWHQDYIQRSAIQTGVPHLNLGILRQIPIQCPPLSEQKAIATILSDMDSEIAALEARRDKTRALKQGMMQELLSGRIRLL